MSTHRTASHPAPTNSSAPSDPFARIDPEVELHLRRTAQAAGLDPNRVAERFVRDHLEPEPEPSAFARAAHEQLGLTPSLRHTAQVTGISEDTLTRWIKAGHIRSTRPNKVRRVIDVASLVAFIEQRGPKSE